MLTKVGFLQYNRGRRFSLKRSKECTERKYFTARLKKRDREKKRVKRKTKF
jgi:hypothetical protein